MTAKGKFVLTLVVLAVVALAAWKWLPKMTGSQRDRASSPEAGGPSTPTAASEAAPAELVETQTEAPKLAPAGAYQPKDNTVDIELSEYAGYAGLIAANGGLEPNDNSVFTKKHGFKLRI